MKIRSRGLNAKICVRCLAEALAHIIHLVNGGWDYWWVEVISQRGQSPGSTRWPRIFLRLCNKWAVIYRGGAQVLSHAHGAQRNVTNNKGKAWGFPNFNWEMGPRREDLELIPMYSQRNNQGSYGEKKAQNMDQRVQGLTLHPPIYCLHALGLVAPLSPVFFHFLVPPSHTCDIFVTNLIISMLLLPNILLLLLL